MSDFCVPDACAPACTHGCRKGLFTRDAPSARVSDLRWAVQESLGQEGGGDRFPADEIILLFDEIDRLSGQLDLLHDRSQWDMSAVLTAAVMAAAAHEGQMWGKYPYVFHCLLVAQDVHDRGGSADMVIAALLHDTLEDTDLSPWRIEHEFGEDVRQMVEALTRRDGETYTSFIDRQRGNAAKVKFSDAAINRAWIDNTDMPRERRSTLGRRYSDAMDLLRHNNDLPQDA